MKKNVILSLFMCLATFVASAQTNFRDISYEEALSVAKKEKKLVFLDLYTDWCGPCKKMAAQVFPTKQVGDFMNKNFVSIKLNAEKEGEALAKQFEIAAYPTFVIVDASGSLVGKVVGYMEGDAFIDKTTAAIDPKQSPESIKQRYEAGERTPRLVNSYALQLMEARKEDDGFAVIDNYFNSLSDKDKLKAENGFIFTRYTIDLNNDRAKFMVANRDKFDKSIKDDIAKRIGALYRSHLITYFSGYMYREGKYDANVYNEFKAEIKGLNLSREYCYDAMFDFIEARVANDDTQFLSYCDAHFDDFDRSEKDLIAMNLTRLISTDNKDLLKGMSKLLRKHVAELSPSGIQLVGRSLYSIESNAKEPLMD